MATELRRRPITVEEYHRMVEAGILPEGERVELLRGDLVWKLTIGDRHRACVMRLNRMIVLAFHDRAAVQTENPVVVLDDSEPEPDLALLAINDGSFGGKRHAYPADVFALIEVADSSRDLDTAFKQRLYAEAGIREYWVVDLVDNVILLNRDPDPAERRYRTSAVARRSETVAFEAFGGDLFSVDEILGPV
jgi:Uma2 family endonuclease